MAAAVPDIKPTVSPSARHTLTTSSNLPPSPLLRFSTPTFLQLTWRIPTSPEGHKGRHYNLYSDGESRATTELTQPSAPVLSDLLPPPQANSA